MFVHSWGNGMNRLEKLIHRIENPIKISNEDTWDSVKSYWEDVVGKYWADVDEDLTEELGVTPTALSELLEVHRHTFDYANVGGNSSVRGYDHGEDWFVVMFSDGSRYLYTLKSTTPEALDWMRKYAMAGKGLNSYIMRLQRENYAGRNYKGNITIRPGMESSNPDGHKRLQLLVAFRNTLPSRKLEVNMHKTLVKYKEQIEHAGCDGLDPTARAIMKVGLESMGIDTRVSMESIDTGEIYNETASLKAVIDSACEAPGK